MTRPKRNDVAERAWLIERDGLATIESHGSVSLHYYAEHRPGRHYWTPDHSKAKRFADEVSARRETNGDPLLRVAEHMWMKSSAFLAKHGGAA